MKTKTINVYSFEELSDSAKDRAFEKNRNINVDYDWWEQVYEDAKEIGKLMGIDIENIYFTGFSSQGDGACFEGRYSYAKGSVKAVKDYAPTDTVLHSIVERLRDIQKKHFYTITAKVKQSGHYMHERCTEIQVFIDGNYPDTNTQIEAETDTVETLRDYMKWIYKSLEAENEYQTSEAAIKETIEANDYEFDEDGNRL